MEVRKLQFIRGQFMLNIPVYMAKGLNWQRGDQIFITPTDNGAIEINNPDVKATRHKKRTIEQIAAELSRKP